MAKIVTKCIYCNSDAKLTREHIFGRWHREIPSKAQTTSHRVSLLKSDRSSSIGFGRLNRPGSPGSHQLRIACIDCNRGWMSDLQNRAKPIALTLAKTGHIKIDKHDLLPFSNWVTMVAMSAEFADLATQLIPQADRQFLKDELRPPISHSVFVACADVYDNQMNYWHRAFEGAQDGNVGYIQTTVFNLGAISIVHISGNYDDLPSIIDIWKNVKISQVWPSAEVVGVPLSFVAPYRHYNMPAFEFWEVAANILSIPQLAGPPP